MDSLTVLNKTKYSGKVKLQFLKGDIPIKEVETHNACTTAFLSYILRCARGEETYTEMPGVIYLFETVNNQYKVINNYGVIYDSITDVTTSESAGVKQAQITFTFLVPDILFTGTKQITKFTINSVSSKQPSDGVYAEVVFDTPQTIDGDTNLNISWTPILNG